VYSFRISDSLGFAPQLEGVAAYLLANSRSGEGLPLLKIIESEAPYVSLRRTKFALSKIPAFFKTLAQILQEIHDPKLPHFFFYFDQLS